MRARGYGPEEVHAFLAALGPSGRRLYAILGWTIDLAIPALISAFLWTTVSLGSLRRWRWLALMGGAADYLENAAVTTLILAFPRDAATLVGAASAVTISKFVLYLTGALLAMAGALAGSRPAPGLDLTAPR